MPNTLENEKCCLKSEKKRVLEKVRFEPTLRNGVKNVNTWVNSDQGKTKAKKSWREQAWGAPEAAVRVVWLEEVSRNILVRR